MIYALLFVILVSSIDAVSYRSCIRRNNEDNFYCSNFIRYNIDPSDIIPERYASCDFSYDALLCDDRQVCGCRKRPPNIVEVPVYVLEPIEIPIEVEVIKNIYIYNITHENNCTNTNCTEIIKEVPVYIVQEVYFNNTVHIPIYLNSTTVLTTDEIQTDTTDDAKYLVTTIVFVIISVIELVIILCFKYNHRPKWNLEYSQNLLQSQS